MPLGQGGWLVCDGGPRFKTYNPDTHPNTEAESLQPRLKTVKADVQSVQKTYNDLESRVEELLADYDNYVRLLLYHGTTSAEIIYCCRWTLYRNYLSPGAMPLTRRKGRWPGSSAKRRAEGRCPSKRNFSNTDDRRGFLQSQMTRP